MTPYASRDLPYSGFSASPNLAIFLKGKSLLARKPQAFFFLKPLLCVCYNLVH
jgi:hypothetical protein